MRSLISGPSWRLIGLLFAAGLVAMAHCQPRNTRQCILNSDLDPASKGVLSPIVILGKLESVKSSESQPGRVSALFQIQKMFKSDGLPTNHARRKDKVLVTFVNGTGVLDALESTSLTNARPGKRKQQPSGQNNKVPSIGNLENSAVVGDNSNLCAFNVRELAKNERYLVYAKAASDAAFLSDSDIWQDGRTSLVAIAAPEQASSPSSRAVRKATCKGCAKPPSVSGLSDVKLEVKKKLKLQCRMKGNPTPKVEWYKDGNKINKKNKKIKITTKKKFSRLEIAQVRLQDSGEYSCRASNILSKNYVSDLARVTVRRKGGNPSNTHGKPCEPMYKDYCLNRGKCLYFQSLLEISCQCAEGYRGIRCENKAINTQGTAPKQGAAEIVATTKMLQTFWGK